MTFHHSRFSLPQRMSLTQPESSAVLKQEASIERSARMAKQNLPSLRSVKLVFLVLLIVGLLAKNAPSQRSSFTWQEVRGRFEARNPTLLADKLSIDELKAQEITAFLRPNPTFALSADGTQIAPDKGIWRPFAGTYESPSFSYLHERQHKRELRLES